MRRRSRALLASLALAAGAAPIPVAPALSAAEDATPDGAAEWLRRAFERRYGAATHQQLVLSLRSDGREVKRQQIEVVTQMEGGRLRALARFTAPEDLRDTALLVLEQDGRPDDYFLYLPALARVRRVSGAQRSDSFMGTDLTYEDLERRRVEDFGELRAEPTEVAGEPALRIGARPRLEARYERVEFLVATRDAALLETRYFGRGGSEPTKVIRFPREHLREEGGFSVPQRIEVENLRNRTRTEVTATSLEVGAKLDLRLFTTGALLREADLGGRETGP